MIFSNVILLFMALSTEYSLWLILPCFLFAGAGAWYLYHNNKLELTGPTGKWIERTLTFFRFLTLFIISFLILGPLLKMVFRKTEKPFIILATDHSQSVVSGKDSSNYRAAVPAALQQVSEELSDNYEVVSYVFGKEARQGQPALFDEKQTDISNMFTEINNAYSGRNIGAIILTSDGIYNEGNNPVYDASEIKAPVYSIALGDTNQRKDILIQQVRYNRVAYAGNIFPMQVDVKAFGCSGSDAAVTLLHNNNILSTQKISVSGNTFFTTLAFEAEAKNEGTQHYILQINKLNGEASYVNNRFDVFIQVINGKQKVLIVANSPHPDVAALKQSIVSNENYEAATLFVNDITPASLTKDISLVILHQLPGLQGEGAVFIRQLHEKKIPVLYVLGALTHPGTFSAVEPHLQLSTNRMSLNEVLPAIENTFSSFTLSDDEVAAIKKFPPLYAPYANYRINGEHDILLKQQIGNVKTDFPLLFLSKGEGVRKGFICGEGIWKWRLYDFNLSKQQTFNTLMGKMVQYLASKDDKGRFRVNHQKRFNENEHILFDAEVYNESYELINTPEVQLTITNNRQKEFSFTFSKTEKAYTLDAGTLPPGSYTYDATTVVNNKKEILKGRFIVEPLQVEFLQTTADHQVLNELASQSGGQVFYLNQTEQLIKAIQNNQNIKPVIYKQEDMKSWINLKWIFFLLLGLMSVEWFIRKWNGAV